MQFLKIIGFILVEQKAGLRPAIPKISLREGRELRKNSFKKQTRCICLSDIVNTRCTYVLTVISLQRMHGNIQRLSNTIFSSFPVNIMSHCFNFEIACRRDTTHKTEK